MTSFPDRSLRGFFDRGHRPAAAGRIGLEVERFVLRPDGGPVRYAGSDGVSGLLAAASRLTSWEEVREGPHLLGLRAPDGGTVSLEPGAQWEWSSPICSGLPELAARYGAWQEIEADLERRCSVRFASVGAHPSAAPEDLPRLPKARYAILEPWLQSQGALGVWMMKCSAGVQVNLDHANEEDAMRKLRTALRLAPVFNAIFANSAVAAGRPSGFASFRERIWSQTDPTRCGMPEILAREGSSFDDYVTWALQAPMLFVEREGKLRDLRGKMFRDWMSEGAATEADWQLHLSTLFPAARFRPHLELRSADGVPADLALGYAALARALFDRPAALTAAEALGAEWNAEQRAAAWTAAQRSALAGADPAGGRLLDRARRLLALAQPLPEEESFLAPVRALLATGRSLAEQQFQHA
jgi:glutamate--cysteine ligase